MVGGVATAANELEVNVLAAMGILVRTAVVCDRFEAANALLTHNARDSAELENAAKKHAESANVELESGLTKSVVMEIAEEKVVGCMDCVGETMAQLVLVDEGMSAVGNAAMETVAVMTASEDAVAEMECGQKVVKIPEDVQDAEEETEYELKVGCQTADGEAKLGGDVGSYDYQNDAADIVVDANTGEEWQTLKELAVVGTVGETVTVQKLYRDFDLFV